MQASSSDDSMFCLQQGWSHSMLVAVVAKGGGKQRIIMFEISLSRIVGRHRSRNP